MANEPTQDVATDTATQDNQFDQLRDQIKMSYSQNNKGDAIQIAFVASSAQRWQGPIGAWLYEMALASARDDRSSVWKRIFWRKPAAALRAVYEGIVKKIPNNRDVAHRLALRMFESAQAIEPEQIISYLSLAPNDAEGLSLVEQTRGEVVTFLAREELKA